MPANPSKTQHSSKEELEELSTFLQESQEWTW
jgi:hypothetical protein